MAIVSARGIRFDVSVPVLIIGGGACGLTAALAAKEGGAEVLVLERDHQPTGSTSLSTGLIPAAGTRLQREKGIEDSAEIFAADIIAKAKHRNDAVMAALVARESGPAIDWLMASHGLEFRLVEGFLYPGHSRIRMHGTDTRTGAQLQAALLKAVEDLPVDVIGNAHVQELFADPSGKVAGARIHRPDGNTETVGCQALVLACNGFGGNPAMVRQHIPEMTDAPYHGHVGNQGDAVKWGLELGAAVADLGGYQGHGAVAHPQGLPVVWAVLTEGGIQVNTAGVRFSNEVRGYSEQALDVVNQPDQVAWNVYDERCQQAALDFSEYRRLREMGAVKTADTIADLAALTRLPPTALEQTLREAERMARGELADPFARDFTSRPPLRAPYCAIRVTGALFHTQGGLAVDAHARVLNEHGKPLPNLFAGGGAARGLSGPSRWGYLSGNGLLTAVVLGRIAGRRAAELVGQGPSARRED